MKLSDIINDRIKQLEKEIKDINTRKKELEKDKNPSNYETLINFLTNLKRIEDIRNLNTLGVSNIIARYIKKHTYNYLEDELRKIKVTYIAKYDKGIKVELNNEQVAFINNYIEEVEKLINYLERKINEKSDDIESLNSKLELKERELNRFKELLVKLSANKELMNEKDFNLVNRIVDDETVNYETKKSVLIEFRNYNVSLINKKEEKIVKEVPVQVVEEDEIKKLFEEFGYSNTMFKYINKYRKEIKSSMDITEARNILQYLTDNNIIKRFPEADLLAICTYGTLSSVTKMYERLKEDNNHVYSVFYEAPTIWVDENKKGVRKKRNKDGKNMPKDSVGVLKTSVMKASYEDMILNDEFFKKHEYDIRLRNSNNKLALTTPHKKVVENYEVFEKYGIHEHSKDVSSIFSYSNITEKLDRFVELGLLNGFSGSYDNVNYIKFNPSFILNASEAHYVYLYYMREEEPQFYYQKLFSDSRNGEIKNEFKKASSIKSKLFGTVNDFINEKFVMSSSYLRNYDYYEEIINNAEDTNIDPDVYSTPEIIELENSARVFGNEYVYVIGGLTFSRLKVLRNYSILRRYSKELYEDAFMYAVTRGSYLSEEAVKRVSDSILYTYTKGGNDGLLKSL
ncbi:MAG: hypothetical protein IKR57_00165 [Bacilli bacterium]|nr:hypothetical protein [Bacilli bacterium]